MTGKGAWLVSSYEIDMYENLLAEPSFAAVHNALTESKVLRARQLSEIFLAHNASADNIRLSHLVAEGDQSECLRGLIQKLREVYGNRAQRQSPYWVFHKMLLHPTTERTDSYDYEPALTSVEPILKEIIAEIESIRRQRFDRRLRDLG